VDISIQAVSAWFIRHLCSGWSDSRPAWGGTGHGSKTDASTRASDFLQITPYSAEI